MKIKKSKIEVEFHTIFRCMKCRKLVQDCDWCGEPFSVHKYGKGYEDTHVFCKRTREGYTAHYCLQCGEEKRKKEMKKKEMKKYKGGVK